MMAYSSEHLFVTLFHDATVVRYVVYIIGLTCPCCIYFGDLFIYINNVDVVINMLKFSTLFLYEIL